MITLLFYSMVLIVGYLAAAVEWRQLLSDAFRISGMKHTGRFIMCLGVILALYVFPFMVCGKIYECT